MVLLDSGNFSANPTAEGNAATEVLLDAMGMLGYSAANVGERDVRAGYDSFERRASKARFPMISANIVRSDSKQPVIPPSVVIEASSPSGRRSVRVGVIGLVRFNPIFRKDGPEGSELEIVHPSEVLGREIEKLRGQKVDLVILLAALHRDDARMIVRAHPGVDFVVGSYGGVYTTEREGEGGAWVLYAGNQGKQIGETRIFFGEDGREPEVVNKLHYLGDIYPADPEMQKFVNDSMRGIAKKETEAGAAYAGSEACMQCHPAVREQWAATRHARAFATLRSEEDRETPACLKCHTTGFEREGGFTSSRATPQLAEVGCESCHGAGRDHIARPARGYGAVGITTCQSCHDLENSPNFDYYSYLERIVHRERGDR